MIILMTQFWCNGIAIGLGLSVKQEYNYDNLNYSEWNCNWAKS